VRGVEDGANDFDESVDLILRWRRIGDVLQDLDEGCEDLELVLELRPRRGRREEPVGKRPKIPPTHTRRPETSFLPHSPPLTARLHPTFVEEGDEARGDVTELHPARCLDDGLEDAERRLDDLGRSEIPLTDGSDGGGSSFVERRAGGGRIEKVARRRFGRGGFRAETKSSEANL
jgi:hypothetical protein